MGCCSSTSTAVQPLTPGEVKGDEDERGSKVDGRGDSAVSKDTTDSGVVMEGTDVPVLPGAVLSKFPPPTSECIRGSNVDRISQDGLLQQESTMQERPKSSEILEELLNEGIIPVGQTGEKGSGAGEAYSIMWDDREGVRPRPPARLVSLNKAQLHPSKEKIEEKMRLTEERPKLREDEVKTHLRTKSACVWGPAPTSSTEVDEDGALTPVEPLQLPLSLDPLDPLPHSQMRREAAEGGEWVRESGGDGREEMGKTDKREGSGENSWESAERVSEDGEETGEEELNQVEELKENWLLTASGELENDSSFQHAEDKEEIF